MSISADKAFDAIESKIKDEPYNVALTTCDTNCHVEYVERMIHFVKERIESSSTTISTYALFISCAMDVMEGRQVVTCDILGVLLQVD